MFTSQATFDSWYFRIQADSTSNDNRFDRSIDFLQDKSPIDCIQAASAENPCCFFIKASNDPNYPTLVHSPILLHQRSLTDGTFSKKAAVHSGVTPSTQVLEIDHTAFFTPIDAQPERPFEITVLCKTQAEFDAIPAPNTRGSPSLSSLRNAIYIPSNLAIKFLDSMSLSAFEIFELFASDYTETTTEEDGSETISAKACDYSHIKSILHWLALFNANDSPVETINYTACLDSSPLSNASKALHNQLLRPTCAPPSTNNQSQTINQNMSQYQERHLQLLQEQSENFATSMASSSSSAEDNKAKGFDKLPSITKSTLLAFLSSDGNTPALDIDQVGKDIFNGKTDYEKAKLLEVHLRKEGIVDISLSIAQSKDIVSGHWTWKNINTPSGFSFVLFSRTDPLTSTSTSEEIRYLSLKTKKDIDASSLKKLTETDIKIPTDEHGILACIQTGTACLKCFKQDAFIVQNLEAFLMDLHSNMHLLRIGCLKDPSFPTAFLCAIDRRVCSYLSQCELHPENLENIPSALICFEDIILNLQQGNFIFTDIPSAIKRARPVTTPPASPLKKKKKEDKTSNRTVTENEAKDKDLICRQDEDYAQTYGRASMISFRPRNCCLRWNLKGYCFSNCPHKRHHRSPNNESKKELLAYKHKCNARS